MPRIPELNEALEGDSDNAEWLCQRAYAHILLANYSCAVEDAKKALQLEPGLPLAFLRIGIAEYQLSRYESAREALTEGLQMDKSNKSFQLWINRCEDMMEQNGLVNRTWAPPPLKYDWYQTESQVIVTIMEKNVPKDRLHVSFAEKELSATVHVQDNCSSKLNIQLLHSIVPQQSTYKILTTKVEIKMKKTEAIRWEKLEVEDQETNIKQFSPNDYPSSSLHTRNWDKVVEDISEEEKKEKLEGDAALNKLFQQIYSDGSDEVKRAMNKSFTESAGTVLSTNWKDVGKRTVDVSPPDDRDAKKD
ncbi:protein SGT1 homolog [Diretmus argenteus]